MLGHDPAAIHAAVRIFLNTRGTTHHRLAAAFSAYQFTVDGATTGADGEKIYPIDDDVDAYLEFLRSYTQLDGEIAE